MNFVSLDNGGKESRVNKIKYKYTYRSIYSREYKYESKNQETATTGSILEKLIQLKQIKTKQ